MFILSLISLCICICYVFFMLNQPQTRHLNLSTKPSINNLSLWLWWLLNKILLITQTTNLSVLNKQRVRINKTVTTCECVSAMTQSNNWGYEAFPCRSCFSTSAHEIAAEFHGSPFSILFSSRWGVRVPRDWITDTDPAGHWITLCLTHRCVPASKLSSGSLSLSSAMANKCQD